MKLEVFSKKRARPGSGVPCGVAKEQHAVADGEFPSHADLVALPIVRRFEQAFRQSTGIALRLLPPGVPRGGGSPCENRFCRLVGTNPGVGTVCWKAEAEAHARAGSTLEPQTFCCFAGLQNLVAPVVLAGRHVATWQGGQVFRRPPTPEDFRQVAAQLQEWGLGANLREVEQAFFGGKVVPEERFRAVQQLLELFAEHLGQHIQHILGRGWNREPRIVRRAKEYVRAHAGEPLTLGQVAAAAGASPFHFCRLFRRSTGMRFTEFVAAVRLDRAKDLLADRTNRVSEVAFAAGFGSIPQFNAVFRRLTGMSPSAYRAARSGDGGGGKCGGGGVPGREGGAAQEAINHSQSLSGLMF
jgi:AraC-like DNA-binding protein